MTLYFMIGSAVGTPDASMLGARLAAWHDAMVAHERTIRVAGGGRCHDECPHAEAPVLWAEALVTFGRRADELAFLKSRATRVRAAPVPSGLGREA